MTNKTVEQMVQESVENTVSMKLVVDSLRAENAALKSALRKANEEIAEFEKGE